MTAHRDAGRPLRGWLAAACIVAPIVFGLVVFNAAFSVLIPHALFPGVANGLTFSGYAPAEPAAAKAAEDAAGGKKAEVKEAPDPVMFLPARDYSARVNFALASGFLFIAALTTLLFSVAVLSRYGDVGIGKYYVTPGRLIGVAAVVWTVFGLLVAFAMSAPHGRYLVVHDLLDKADTFEALGKFALTWGGVRVSTGTVADWVVHFNTAVSLMPVGMLLTALAVVTLAREPLSPDALKARLTVLRVGLALGSACFVIAVLSNKALVDWPLQLVRDSQARALRPIADSLVSQFGALGSAALFAAFAPAFVAWLLDLQSLREKDLGDAADTAEKRAAALAEIEKLSLAPMSAIGSVVAMLAPVLASPVVDSLKSLLGGITK